MVTVVIEWFSKGGIIMWPILLFSVYGVALCFERWMSYKKEEKALSSRWTIINDTAEKTKEGTLSLFNEDYSSDRITRVVLGNGDTDQSVLIEQVRCTYLDENAKIEKRLLGAVAFFMGNHGRFSKTLRKHDFSQPAPPRTPMMNGAK